MSKYIIKKKNDKWNYDFESDKFEIKIKDNVDFDEKADILSYLKDLKHNHFPKLKFIDSNSTESTEKLSICLEGKEIAECVVNKEEDKKNIICEFNEAKIDWENQTDNPAQKEQKNDTTENTGPTGS